MSESTFFPRDGSEDGAGENPEALELIEKLEYFAESQDPSQRVQTASLLVEILGSGEAPASSLGSLLPVLSALAEVPQPKNGASTSASGSSSAVGQEASPSLGAVLSPPPPRSKIHRFFAAAVSRVGSMIANGHPPPVQPYLDAAAAAARIALCEKAGELAATLIQADPEGGYARVCTELLPFYESLLQLKIPEVASAAAEAVVVVATHLRDEERLKVVLPLSLRLCNGAAVNASDEAANGEEDAESDFNTANGKTRLSLLSLLAHLAELLPREVYGHFILPQLLFVATEDPLVAVRCSALRFIAATAKHANPEVLRLRLVPAVLRPLDVGDRFSLENRFRESRSSYSGPQREFGMGGAVASPPLTGGGCFWGGFLEQDPQYAERAAAAAGLYDVAAETTPLLRLALLLPAMRKCLADPEVYAWLSRGQASLKGEGVLEFADEDKAAAVFEEAKAARQRPSEGEVERKQEGLISNASPARETRRRGFDATSDLFSASIEATVKAFETADPQVAGREAASAVSLLVSRFSELPLVLPPNPPGYYEGSPLIAGLVSKWISEGQAGGCASVLVSRHPAACCAYTFAAVLQRVPDGWRSLRSAFSELSTHPCVEVRSSLASSLHLTAEALQHSVCCSRHGGNTAAESEAVFPACGECSQERRAAMASVLSAALRFLGDEATKVQHSAVKSLGALCGSLGMAEAVVLLQRLAEVLAFSGLRWTIRLLAAQELPALCKAGSQSREEAARVRRTEENPREAEKEIRVAESAARGVFQSAVLELFFSLVEDPVASVRKAACEGFPECMRCCCPTLLAELEKRGASLPPVPVLLELSRSSTPRPEESESAVSLDGDGKTELRNLAVRLTRSPEAAVVQLVLSRFALHSSHTSRKLFIHLCDHAIRELPLPFFRLYLLRPLARLSMDRDRGVRLLWLQIFKPHLNRRGGLLSDDALLVCAAQGLIAVELECIRKQQKQRSRERLCQHELRLKQLVEQCQWKDGTQLYAADGFDLEDLQRLNPDTPTSLHNPLHDGLKERRSENADPMFNGKDNDEGDAAQSLATETKNPSALGFRGEEPAVDGGAPSSPSAEKEAAHGQGRGLGKRRGEDWAAKAAALAAKSAGSGFFSELDLVGRHCSRRVCGGGVRGRRHHSAEGRDSGLGIDRRVALRRFRSCEAAVASSRSPVSRSPPTAEGVSRGRAEERLLFHPRVAERSSVGDDRRGSSEDLGGAESLSGEEVCVSVSERCDNGSGFRDRTEDALDILLDLDDCREASAVDGF